MLRPAQRLLRHRRTDERGGHHRRGAAGPPHGCDRPRQSLRLRPDVASEPNNREANQQERARRRARPVPRAQGDRMSLKDIHQNWAWPSLAAAIADQKTSRRRSRAGTCWPVPGTHESAGGLPGSFNADADAGAGQSRRCARGCRRARRRCWACHWRTRTSSSRKVSRPPLAAKMLEGYKQPVRCDRRAAIWPKARSRDPGQAQLR